MRSPIGLGIKQSTAGHNLILDPRTPWDSALAFIETKYSAGETRTLLHQGGVFYAWSGTHYSIIDPDTIRSEVYYFLDSADCITKDGNLLPIAPTARRVTDVVDALKGATNLSGRHPPTWLSDASDLPPFEIIACRNGLLHVPTRKLLPHTPDFFTLYALPYAYDPNAPQPREWLSFLKSIWGNDEEAIAALQEIIGYLLTCDTRQQKLFLIVGPTRSGKGTIARVLTALLGSENVAAPTLASIATNFGLAPLIGRQLAIISDARLGNRSDQQVIVERLLSISGEDSLTIDRKYLGSFTGRLPTRFVILTNELPRLTDASGALARRFVTLVLTNSFYGREDHGLATRLLMELPSILNWALDGRDRLSQRGYFVQPRSSVEVAQELEELGSPISAFLRECCEVGPEKEVEIDTLYEKWRNYCNIQGRDRPTTKQVFGRDLRAAVPTLKVIQPRDGKERSRLYKGVGLKPEEARKAGSAGPP
jgi:putative DNA primase/helicase